MRHSTALGVWVLTMECNQTAVGLSVYKKIHLFLLKHRCVCLFCFVYVLVMGQENELNLNQEGWSKGRTWNVLITKQER
jgi:hypothetical protein